METYTIEIHHFTGRVIYYDWDDSPKPIMVDVSKDSIDMLCEDDLLLAVF